MSEQQEKGTNWVAVITMMFIYGMISFVTNLAAPMGNVWKYQPGIDGSNMLGMMGNMMNFLAYVFMGIPAGRMLTNCGYKKTAMIGIATGFVGVLIQFLSGKIPFTDSAIVPFSVYLLGAFVCGFAVCMLNMVVNPMLNLLGGGGNRGNQLNMIGTTFNSLAGTATPVLVLSLIGEVSNTTKVADVNLVMYIALTVFAVAFAILAFIPIANPEQGTTSEKNVGVEVGIPGTMGLWLPAANGPLVKAGIANAATVTTGCVAVYWLLMLVGRTIGAFIGGKVSSRILMVVTTVTAISLLVVGVLLPETVTVSMPVIDVAHLKCWMATVPMTALLFALCGLCTSIMWPSTFNLATEKLGKYTAAASGLFMVMVVGGGVLPLVQNFIADKAGFMIAYIVPIFGLAYMFVYSAFLSKPPKNIDELVK